MSKPLSLLIFIVLFTSCKKDNPPPVNIESVTICNQVWMKKNLEVLTYRNGDPIPEVTDKNEWAALTTGAWCYFDNDTANGTIYGKLYNWYAVNDQRGLAPAGWHVPSDAEWVTLENCLGGPDLAGGAIGVADGTNSTNSSGFTGLPGGSRDFDGTFIYLHYNSNWWSSTADGATNAFGRGYSWIGTSLGRPSVGKQLGFYVRCLKD